MNVAVITLGKNQVLQNAAKIFSKKLYSKGDMVKEINGDVDKYPLIGFQYFILIVDAGSLFQPNSYDVLTRFLKEYENICSCYVSIFINKRFRAEKHLLRYMKLLESNGILIHSSGIIENEKSANDFAEKITPIKAGT